MSKDNFILLCYVVIFGLCLYTLSCIWSISTSLNRLVELEKQKLNIEQQTQDKLQNIETSINSLTLWIKFKK